jgi:hypothetical protein
MPLEKYQYMSNVWRDDIFSMTSISSHRTS